MFKFFLGALYAIIITALFIYGTSRWPDLWIYLNGLPSGTTESDWYRALLWSKWMIPLTYTVVFGSVATFMILYYSRLLPGCSARKTT